MHQYVQQIEFNKVGKCIYKNITKETANRIMLRTANVNGETSRKLYNKTMNIFFSYLLFTEQFQIN